MQEPTREPIKRLIGAEFAAVTFVRDYIQLGFDGATISAMTPIAVTTEGQTVRSGDDQFRNRLCDQIGKSVAAVDVRPGEALTIGLADGSQLSLSLRPEHHTGPEAIVLHGADGQIIVF